jgi:hypothetical protein
MTSVAFRSERNQVVEVVSEVYAYAAASLRWTAKGQKSRLVAKQLRKEEKRK